MENQEDDVVVVAKVTSEADETFEDEGLVSNSTLEKVAAAKKYIENHYNKRMRHIQQRKERYFWWNLFAYHLFVDIPKRIIKRGVLQNFTK